MKSIRTGYLRITEILGDQTQGVQPLIPVSKTAWYDGIKRGIYPKPVKLGNRTSAWRSRDIQELIDNGPMEALR
jgi:prophage regulatory protein